MSSNAASTDPTRQMTDNEIAYEVCVLQQFDRAAMEMDSYFRPRLRAHGRSKSTKDGEDVADQVCTDAIKEDERGKKPLVCQWRESKARSGGGGLEGYLKTVVTHRLYTSHRRNQKMIDWEPGTKLPDAEEDACKPSDSPESADPATHDHSVSARHEAEADSPQFSRGAALAAKIILKATKAAVRRFPKQMVCKWLVQDCGCQQRAMGVLFGPLRKAQKQSVDEATISNWVKQAEDAWTAPVKEAVSAGEVSHAEVTAAVSRWSQLLTWGTTEPLPAWKPARELKQRLQQLVRGKVPAHERNELMAGLAEHPEQVRWLGSLIRQGGTFHKETGDESTSAPTSDWRLRGPTGLRGLHGKVVLGSLRHLHTLTPVQAGKLLEDLEAGLHHLTRRVTGACTGTLWLISANRRQLVAAFNPVEGSAILGKIQRSEDGGVIWRVWESERPERIAIMSANERFSSKIDKQTRKHSQSMIAVPFRVHGEMQGVLTMLRTGVDAPAFPLGELDNVNRLSQLLASALEAQLARTALSRASKDEAVQELRTASLELEALWPHLLPEMQADELASLLPPRSDEMIALGCRDIGATSGSLWLRQWSEEGAEQLMICLNPHEARLRRHFQPSGQGIVGCSYQLGRALLIPDVSKVQQWAGAETDKKAGKNTCAMIATPVVVHGIRVGVLTFVQHDRFAPIFDDDGLKCAGLLAQWFSKTLEHRLMEDLLSPSAKPKIKGLRAGMRMPCGAMARLSGCERLHPPFLHPDAQQALMLQGDRNACFQDRIVHHQASIIFRGHHPNAIVRSDKPAQGALNAGRLEVKSTCWQQAEGGIG